MLQQFWGHEIGLITGSQTSRQQCDEECPLLPAKADSPRRPSDVCF